jgi:hypothetical protein
MFSLRAVRVGDHAEHVKANSTRPSYSPGDTRWAVFMIMRKCHDLGGDDLREVSDKRTSSSLSVIGVIIEFPLLGRCVSIRSTYGVRTRCYGTSRTRLLFENKQNTVADLQETVRISTLRYKNGSLPYTSVTKKQR